MAADAVSTGRNADAQEADRQYVILGRFSAVHGVRGWLKVYSHTDPIEKILDYRPWLVGEDRKPYDSVTGQKHGKGLIARLQGVDDRDTAAVLIGRDIAVERSRLPALPDGRYYWADLIGLEVVNHEGLRFGHVRRIMPTGANDVLVIHGERERLVPFVMDKYIRQVCLEHGVIHVEWDADF